MSIYIIAEAGVNHNGSLDMTLQLADAAAEAGADAVKFQTFTAARLVRRDAPKAEYQKQTTGTDESQYEMLSRLELPREAHFVLLERYGVRGIEFLSTPFDEESLDFLTDELGLKTIKLGSGEVTNGPLLLRTARKGVTVILSTEMSTLGEVETLRKMLLERGRRSLHARSPSSTARVSRMSLPSYGNRTSLHRRMNILVSLRKERCVIN